MEAVSTFVMVANWDCISANCSFLSARRIKEGKSIVMQLKEMRQRSESERERELAHTEVQFEVNRRDELRQRQGAGRKLWGRCEG